MAQKLILDADPGRDDAVAFMLAALSPEMALLGVMNAVQWLIETLMLSDDGIVLAPIDPN